MRKTFISFKEEERIENFTRLLNSYSHKKFYDYLSIPEVSVLFRVVFEKEGVEEFIRKHKTLQKNKEAYGSHIKELLKTI
jgi:hypothetical protein